MKRVIMPFTTPVSYIESVSMADSKRTKGRGPLADVFNFGSLVTNLTKFWRKEKLPSLPVADMYFVAHWEGLFPITWINSLPLSLQQMALKERLQNSCSTVFTVSFSKSNLSDQLEITILTLRVGSSLMNRTKVMITKQGGSTILLWLLSLQGMYELKSTD